MILLFVFGLMLMDTSYFKIDTVVTLPFTPSRINMVNDRYIYLHDGMENFFILLNSDFSLHTLKMVNLGFFENYVLLLERERKIIIVRRYRIDIYNLDTGLKEREIKLKFSPEVLKRCFPIHVRIARILGDREHYVLWFTRRIVSPYDYVYYKVFNIKKSVVHISFTNLDSLPYNISKYLFRYKDNFIISTGTGENGRLLKGMSDRIQCGIFVKSFKTGKILNRTYFRGPYCNAGLVKRTKRGLLLYEVQNGLATLLSHLRHAGFVLINPRSYEKPVYKTLLENTYENIVSQSGIFMEMPEDRSVPVLIDQRKKIIKVYNDELEEILSIPYPDTAIIFYFSQSIKLDKNTIAVLMVSRKNMLLPYLGIINKGRTTINAILYIIDINRRKLTKTAFLNVLRRKVMSFNKKKNELYIIEKNRLYALKRLR